MVHAATIRAAVDAYFAANNARDAQVVARLFVADARMHRVPGVELVEGREAIRQVYAQLRGALARAEVEAVRRFIAGDGAAALYRGTLTVQSGRSVVMEGINVFALDDAGEIAAISYYWDPAPLIAILQG